MVPDSDDPPPPDTWAEGTPAPRPRPLSRGGCPRCRAPLSQRIAGELDLDVCVGCAGVFISDVAMAQLVLAGGGVVATLRGLADLPAQTARPLAPGIAWCPACALPMGSCGLGSARALVCRAHGVWLDRPFVAAAADALANRATGRQLELERAVFGDLVDRRRWSVILAHARALGSRTRGVRARGSIGLLADLFG